MVRELPRLGYLVNAHASLLPRHRGAAPIANAILAGDAKTGISGAGRQASEAYGFSELDADCHAYKPGRAHRHVPEIEQEASAAAGAEVRVSFVPYLIPTTRGMATSVFVRPRGVGAAEARSLLCDAYAAEPFVRVLPEGETPTLQAVRGTNYCDVALFADESNDTWILLSTLDNLGKGASGGAVQCANLMCGFGCRAPSAMRTPISRVRRATE